MPRMTKFGLRVPSTALDTRAVLPRTLRDPTAEEARRGIVAAYAPANFAIYRTVIERLAPNDRFRMETQFGAYEMSRLEFERTFQWLIATASYSTGSPSMPGKCYYVQGPPPLDARPFLVSG